MPPGYSRCCRRPLRTSRPARGDSSPPHSAGRFASPATLATPNTTTSIFLAACAGQLRRGCDSVFNTPSEDFLLQCSAIYFVTYRAAQLAEKRAAESGGEGAAQSQEARAAKKAAKAAKKAAKRAAA